MRTVGLVGGLVLGCLLLQFAWVLALPPFRGTDEFDHAYRAAEVAGGEWLSDRPLAEHGRGHLVAVPRSIVAAARPICASYAYTGIDNCTPVKNLDNGRVLVASAASAYNPLFYWVVGTAAKPFDGATALYAMRIASAVLCAAAIGLAGWVTTLWARSAWPLLSLLLAMTPVMVFSISVAAPNGLEMAAALCLWCSLIGLGHVTTSRRYTKALVASATLSAVIVTTLRSIGPLWVALIVITSAIYLGRRAVGELVRRQTFLLLIASVIIGIATLASVWWTRVSQSAALVPDSGAVKDPWGSTFHQLPWWFFQVIAAFPRRSIPAPPLVYVLVVFIFLGFIVTGLVFSSNRSRWTLLVCGVASVLVPVVLTRISIEVTGPMWQGRYGLPYHMGLALVAGTAIDLRPDRRLSQLWPVAGFIGIATAQVISIQHVFTVERQTSPLAHSADWIHFPTWLVFAAAAFGCCFWGAALIWSRPFEQPTADAASHQLASVQ